ncbi:hypothetical protein J2Z21_002395 [Streptomyces griseochromogenes]|uniref:Secreted protein n=1 Tax=Streptomyces griseochromogenes TaxID=68214 RepID=A0A1B1AR32_9ACTN|nr:hypothetical protein [Streptomyces griseochromogenes]ANP49023.1 hypothetical protein AVL59_05010 [Streptomyces griseochromogenes]MBP2049464.1 hypothetical protein [Streptomyces griseochromogenes]
MHKLRRTAVLVAALSTVGLMGAGTAYAGGGGWHDAQSSNCKDHDLNLDLLGEVGILNGLLGNALNGEGDPGAQGTHVGSTMGCNNSVGR